MHNAVATVSAGVLAVLFTFMAHPAAAGQSAQAIQQAVEETLGRDRDLRQIEVSVEGTEVILSGRVERFWNKHQAIERALAVDGVETVASELEIPRAEDDTAVAQGVMDAVQNYAFYTMWDHIDGMVNNGVVTLTGRVVPDRDKASEIFERVAKVRGVQDLESSIETITPSTADQNLRAIIARRIFGSSHFARFRTMQNPPFHIIVQNSVVTLLGYVQSQIEYREMERLVGSTSGVLRVVNELETIS